MEQITTILKENDIAGFVVLHTPGFSEYMNAVSPSYSCATAENGQLRVRLKTSEVGQLKAKQLAGDTYNMATHFADNLAKFTPAYIDFHQLLKEHWGGEEGSGTDTTHQQQNN